MIRVLVADDQSLVREIFGEGDITHESREAADQPRGLDPPDRIDGPIRFVRH